MRRSVFRRKLHKKGAKETQGSTKQTDAAAKEKKASFHSRWLLLVTNFLLQMDFCYCLLLTGFYVQRLLGYGKYEPARYVGILLFFAAIYLVSRKITRTGWIIALDIAVVILAGCIYPLSYNKAWLVISLLLFALIDVLTKGDPGDRARTIVWFTNNSAYWGIGIWVLIAVSAVTGALWGKGMPSLQTACVQLELIIFCIFLAEFFIQKYLYVIYEYYQKVRLMDKLDVRYVRRVASFAAVISAAIAVCIFFVSGYLGRFFSWIVSLLSGKGGPEQIQEVRETAQPLVVDNSLSRIAGNANRFLKYNGPKFSLSFTNIYVQLLAFAIILLVLWIVYRKLGRARYVQADDDNSVTVIERIPEEERASAKSGRSVHYGSSNNEQIRRAFKRFADAHLKKHSADAAHMTSGELTREFVRGGMNKQDAKELNSLYGYARYSGAQADDEQAARAKELCRED